MKVTPQYLASVRPWSNLTAPLLSRKGRRVGQTEYKSAPLGKLLHNERVSDEGGREGEGGNGSPFLRRGLHLHASVGCATQSPSRLAQKTHCRFDLISRFIQLSSRSQAATNSKCDFSLGRSHRRMVDEVIWMMQWLRNGRCPPNGTKL